MRPGGLMRGVHRVHRWLGSMLALLMLTWFASGLVMVWKRYPSYSEPERLHDAPELRAGLADAPPPELERWLSRGSSDGERASLAMLEGRATWTLTDEHGARVAVRADTARTVSPLTAARARAEAERRFGLHARDVSRVEKPDQWTVGRVARGYYPLYRVAFDDAEDTEVYVSAQSGEIVQASTRRERLWCWLGAIPHWIYPAVLRRERELWRTSVLVLSGIGLVLSISGLWAGLHIARRRSTRAGSAPVRVRNRYLRWHQRIGLVFGACASTWLFSGMLSLSPFHWSGPDPSPDQLALIHAGPSDVSAALRQLPAALASCRRALPVRELELFTFAGRAFITCLGREETRTLSLADPTLEPKRFVAATDLEVAAKRLASAHAFMLTSTSAPDDYYYPVHDQEFVRPHALVSIADAVNTAWYLDPARPRVLAYMTRGKRWERWLYNGLHSWDFPWLYRAPVAWRSVIALAMFLGVALSCLGLVLPIGRMRRRWLNARRRARASAHT